MKNKILGVVLMFMGLGILWGSCFLVRDIEIMNTWFSLPYAFTTFFLVVMILISGMNIFMRDLD